MEYHKPAVSMRNKEAALNWACAQILPIEAQMERQLIMVCNSRPKRLNAELGKRMIAENPIENTQRQHDSDDSEDWDSEYESSSDDDEEEEDDKGDSLYFNKAQAEEFINQNLGNDERRVNRQIESQVKRQIKETHQEVQREAAGFQIDAESMKEEYSLLLDFPIKPYPEPWDITSKGYQALPINFYDNDDGYWDNYLKMKYEKFDEYSRTKMIVGRPFFKH